MIRAAASPALLRHRGPAVVFHSYQEMRARVDDPALDVTAGWLIPNPDARLAGARGYGYDFLAARTPGQLTFRKSVIGRS